MSISDLILSSARGKIVLIYGEAGSGKTNLTLCLLSQLARKYYGLKHYFISTEGRMFKHVLERYGLHELRNVYFTEVVSSEHLIDVLLRLSRYSGIGSVVIDSINNYYRVDALYRNDAGKLLNLALSFTAWITLKNNSYALLTAQVHYKGEEISISGSNIVLFWSDIIVKLSKTPDGYRVAEIYSREFKKNLRVKFKITSKGVEVIE